MSDAEVSGWAPKSFMSRAESHEVGGDGNEGSSEDVGEGKVSHENGAGDELAVLGLSAFSLRVMVTVEVRCDGV